MATQQVDPMTKPLLNVEEAAAFLGLGRAAAYRAVNRGDIPSIRIGHSLKVPTAKLLALLGITPDTN